MTSFYKPQNKAWVITEWLFVEILTLFRGCRFVFFEVHIRMNDSVYSNFQMQQYHEFYCVQV